MQNTESIPEVKGMQKNTKRSEEVTLEKHQQQILRKHAKRSYYYYFFAINFQSNAFVFQ